MRRSVTTCVVCQLSRRDDTQHEVDVFVCAQCHADAKQFLEIQDRIWPGAGEAERSSEQPERSAPSRRRRGRSANIYVPACRRSLRDHRTCVLGAWRSDVPSTCCGGVNVDSGHLKKICWKPYPISTIGGFNSDHWGRSPLNRWSEIERLPLD